MRDPNRLDDFYTKLCKLHKANFPDMRFGQFIENFKKWRNNNDLFYIEDDKLLEQIDVFIYALTGKVNYG